jgi:Holliday junction resolvase RusA-like endonuclease
VNPSLRFTVYGSPQPAGSKKAFVRGKHASVVDANPKAKGWKTWVAQAAGEAMSGRPLFDGPLSVTFRFYRARPKSHRLKGGGLSAEGKRNPYPATRPDLLKLARGTEDAMTGVVWTDDALIVDEMLSKDWGEPERVVVIVYELSEEAP